MGVRLKIAAAAAGVVALGGAWLLLAPTQLGGSTAYAVVDGNSMQPLLHRGDLVLVRPRRSYRVGEVVLYRSSVLHADLLHRVEAIQGGRYWFKGDHNDFVDPGSATRDQLLGQLWVHVPRAGAVLGWLARPVHVALAATLATLVLFAGLGVSRAPRRPALRGRRRAVAYDLDGAAGAVLGGLLLSLALAAALLVVGFRAPAHRVVPVAGAYRQAGSFVYAARATRPTGVYANGVVVSGQPVFVSLVKTVTLRFAYSFQSRLPHRVRGTVTLRASFSSPSTSWYRSIALSGTKRFSGDGTTVTAALRLQRLLAFMREVNLVAGTSGQPLSATLDAIVHVSGRVGSTPIDTRFEPAVPITLTENVLEVAPPATATLPGATYAAPTPAERTNAVLNPVQLGSTPEQATNHVAVLRYALPVAVVRILGLAAAALSLVLAVGFRVALARSERLPLEERIARHLGCVVVPVRRIAEPGVQKIVVPEFGSLAATAAFLNRPILRETQAHQRVYAVDDGPRRLVHIAAPGELPPPAAGQPPGPPRRPTLRGAFPVLFVAAVALALGAVATASNVVPPSKAGVSTKPAAVGQLAPALCGKLQLSRLVVGGGLVTVGTHANELILGSSGRGAHYIDGGGGSDCIVAGGGRGTTNVVDGGSAGSHSVCIAPARSNTVFEHCAVIGRT